MYPSSDAYIAMIEAESGQLAEVFAAGPADAQVPGCPDWDLKELVVHQGSVQHWATEVINTLSAPASRPEVGEPLDEWFAQGTAGLLAAFAAADPDTECWNFWPNAPQNVAFWHRRQALEVAVHRWDAESAVSDSPTPFSPEVGADIVDEFVHVMLRRQLGTKDLSALDGDVHLHCTDTDGEWTFEITDGHLCVVDEHRKAAVAAKGSASDLALLCYNRGDRSRVEIFGDQALLDRWLAIP